MEPLESSAYHESGRIFFAYQNGYSCDGVEISAIDGGNGKSKLNGGGDIPVIQSLLSGEHDKITTENKDKAIDVAKKLCMIYCAGTCVRVFKEYEGSIDSQTEFDIPGQDLKQIERLQNFLVKYSKDHSENYISQTMAKILGDLKSTQIINPIEKLALKLFKSEDHKCSRFEIEDALMSGGFKVSKPKSIGNMDFNIKEDTSPSTETSSTINKEQILDDTLVKFLQLLRKEWTKEEMKEAIAYLKTVFKNYGS